MPEYQNRPAEAEPSGFRAAPAGGDPKSLLREYVDVSRIRRVFPIAAAAAYLIVSFATGWWAYTWILFLLIPVFYAALPVWNDYRAHKGARGVVDMRGNGPAPGHAAAAGEFRVRPRQLKGLILAAIAPVYFIVSFATGAWAVTWLIFLLAPLAGVIRD